MHSQSSEPIGWHAVCPWIAGPQKQNEGGMSLVLLTIIVVLLLLALLGGGFGMSRGWGYYGWSPLGLLILIVLILAMTGNLSFA